MNDVIYNFLFPAKTEKDLCELELLDVDRDWIHFGEGMHCWILETFLILKKMGQPVALSRYPRKDAINIGHQVYLNSIKPYPEAFLVSVQADYRRHRWADCHIVENKLQLGPRCTYWLPHWPPVGLMPRDPERNRVETVAYTGKPLWLAGGESTWRNSLKEIGLSFRMLYEENWNDLSKIDLLIAIRSFDKNQYVRRPPWKLFQAWSARIPLIAGYDSAYQQVAVPGESYIRVKSFETAIKAIKKVADDKEEYRRIVENGKKAFSIYKRENTAIAWAQLLNEKILGEYKQWFNRSVAKKRGKYYGARAAFYIVNARSLIARAIRRTSRSLFSSVLFGFMV